MTQTKKHALQITKKMIAMKHEQRKSLFLSLFYMESEEGAVLPYYIQSQQLYQSNPRETSTYTEHKSYSPTDSLQSYQNKAEDELSLLEWNKRIPIMDFVLHFLKKFSIDKIIDHRKKIFRYLKEHGIEAVGVIEVTRDKNGNPSNKVHFHILTDDPRSEIELRKLFNTACERPSVGLIRGKDFRIDYRPLPDGEGYFHYFTKFGPQHKKKVILFKKVKMKKKGDEGKKEKRLQKFYQIGSWFKDANNIKKSKMKMREEIKADKKKKDEEREKKLQELIKDFFKRKKESQ